MNTLVRRIIAVVGGILFLFGGFEWAFYGSGIAMRIFRHEPDLQSVIGPDAIYKKFGDVYSSLGIFGLCFATGIAFAMIVWDRRPPQSRTTALFTIFLLLVLPLALLNYWSCDLYVSRWRQALVDIVLAFLGLITATNLYHMKLDSSTSRILQSMALFFIVFQAVIIPSIYCALWLLNWEQAIRLADTKTLTPGWISALSGIGSLSVSLLRYYRQPAAPEETSPIIT